MGSYYADYMKRRMAQDEDARRQEERDRAQKNALILQGLQVAGKTALDWRKQNILESNLKDKGILRQSVGSQGEGTALYNEVTPDSWLGKAGQFITGKKTYEANPAIMTAIGKENPTEAGRKAAFNLAYGGAQGKKLYDEWSEGAGSTVIPDLDVKGASIPATATTDAEIQTVESKHHAGHPDYNPHIKHKEFVEKYSPRVDTYFDDYDIDQEFPNQEIIVDPDAPMSTFGEWDSPPPIPLDKPAVDPKIDHSVIPILDEVKADLRKPSHDQVMNFGKGNLNVEAKNIGTEIDLEKQTVPNIKTQDGANVGDTVKSMSNNVRKARVDKSTPEYTPKPIDFRRPDTSPSLDVPKVETPDIKDLNILDKGKNLLDKGQDVLGGVKSLENIAKGDIGAKDAVNIAKYGSKVLGDKAGDALSTVAGQAGGALDVFSAGANLFDEESSAVSKVGSTLQLASAIPGVGQVAAGVGTVLQIADAFFGGGDGSVEGDSYASVGNKGRDDYARYESSNRAMKRERFRRRLRS